MEKKPVPQAFGTNRLVIPDGVIYLNNALPAFRIAGFDIQPFPIVMIRAKEAGASGNFMRDILLVQIDEARPAGKEQIIEREVRLKAAVCLNARLRPRSARAAEYSSVFFKGKAKILMNHDIGRNTASRLEPENIAADGPIDNIGLVFLCALPPEPARLLCITLAIARECRDRDKSLSSRIYTSNQLLAEFASCSDEGGPVRIRLCSQPG